VPKLASAIEAACLSFGVRPKLLLQDDTHLDFLARELGIDETERHTLRAVALERALSRAPGELV